MKPKKTVQKIANKVGRSERRTYQPESEFDMQWSYEDDAPVINDFMHAFEHMPEHCYFN